MDVPGFGLTADGGLRLEETGGDPEEDKAWSKQYIELIYIYNTYPTVHEWTANIPRRRLSTNKHQPINPTFNYEKTRVTSGLPWKPSEAMFQKSIPVLWELGLRNEWRSLASTKQQQGMALYNTDFWYQQTDSRK